jgi:hypothetical protein
MQWSQAKQQIRAQVTSASKGILKCDGIERRSITSNNGKKIGMRTGAKTDQTKAVTYEMIEFAFQTLTTNGKFDSSDFKSRFGPEYASGQCRYSMTGGILVEIGIATLVPKDRDEQCKYLLKSHT